MVMLVLVYSFSKSSVHCQMAPLLWIYGEAEQHGECGKVKEVFLPFGHKEAE